MTITMETVAGWKMREAAHYNGGKEWFGYGHHCIDNRRLYRLDRYTRKDRGVVSTWSVDGADCASLEEAVERLNEPVVVTADELTMLGGVNSCFEPLKDVRAREPYTTLPEAASILHYGLRRKGLVLAEAGRVRRTELGDQVLAKALGQ